MSEEIDGRCKPPFRYPARVRDTALELWGFRCGRDYGCTLREVLAVGKAEGWPCLPNVDTLRDWARREDWDGQIAERLRAIAPGMAERAVIDLILCACEGAAFMRDVMSGKIPKPSGIQARIAVEGVRAIGLDALARHEFATLLGRTLSAPSAKPAQLPASSETEADALRSAVVARLLAAEHEPPAETP